MILPGRLASTTLGDLLGALHRARTTGALELVEIASAGRGVPGRRHKLHLVDGDVAGVETDLAPPAADTKARVDALYALPDASIHFHVAKGAKMPRALEPSEFLHGRPRARDVRAESSRRTTATMIAPTAEAIRRARAFAVLGLKEGAKEVDVRRAFRRLASAEHPDQAASANVEDQRRRAARLAELSAAYHTLVA